MVSTRFVRWGGLVGSIAAVLLVASQLVNRFSSHGEAPVLGLPWGLSHTRS
jgi:hypothetical protein